MTAATRQLDARSAGFNAIVVAERHLSLGATSPSQLEALADAILDAASGGPTTRALAAAQLARQAKAAQATACRIDRWAARQDIPAVRADLILAGQVAGDLVAQALAPAARRSVSRAERKEATRLVDKTLCRSVKPTRATRAAVKAQQARVSAIAEGRAVVLPTNPFVSVAVPTVSRARLAERASRWVNPDAGLAAAWEAFLTR